MFSILIPLFSSLIAMLDVTWYVFVVVKIYMKGMVISMCKGSREKQCGLKFLPIVSVLLGAAVVATSIAYFIWHSYSDKVYREKWKDYNDCGLA